MNQKKIGVVNQRGKKQIDGRRNHTSDLAPSGGVGEFQHPGPAATTATGSGTVARQVDCRDLKEGRICSYFDVLSKPNKKNNNTAELCKIGSMRRHHCLLDLDALPPMLSFEDIVVVHLGQRKGQELATVGTDSAYCKAVRWLSTYSSRYLGELKQCLTDL